MRRPVLLLLLVALLAPGAGAAQACDITQVDTLEIELPAAPAAVGAGRTLSLPVTITRAGQPAGGVGVFAALGGAGFAAYKGGVSDASGGLVLELPVPSGARGAVELDVQAHRTLIELPCAGIEEYDRVTQAWGRAR